MALINTSRKQNKTAALKDRRRLSGVGLARAHPSGGGPPSFRSNELASLPQFGNSCNINSSACNFRFHFQSEQELGKRVDER